MTSHRTILTYLLIAAALYASVTFFALLAPLLLSLILVLLLSMALNPLIMWLRRFTGGRMLATSLVVGTLLIAGALVLWSFTGPMKKQVVMFSEKMPNYWERVQRPLIKLERKAKLSEQKSREEVSVEIAEEAEAAGEPPATESAKQSIADETSKESGNIRSGLGQVITDLAGNFQAMAVNGAEMLLVAVTVFFGVLFTLVRPRPVFGAFFMIVPEKHHPRLMSVLQRTSEFAPTWLLATVVNMMFVSVMVFLLMLPFFSVMDALVLGLLAGMMEAVPYIGPTVSLAIALLFAAGEGGWTPLWVLVIYLAIQVLENNLVMPLLLAGSMKLHPLAVLFSMLLCVGIFGVLGIVIAAPMVAFVGILHSELYRERYLPSVTDDDLDRMARGALRQSQA